MRKAVVAATGLMLVLTSALAVVTTYQAHTRRAVPSSVPPSTPGPLPRGLGLPRHRAGLPRW